MFKDEGRLTLCRAHAILPRQPGVIFQAGGWMTKETEFISWKEPEIFNSPKHPLQLRPTPPFFHWHWSPGSLSSDIKQLGVNPTAHLHPHPQSIPILETLELCCFRKSKN